MAFAFLPGGHRPRRRWERTVKRVRWPWMAMPLAVLVLALPLPLWASSYTLRTAACFSSFCPFPTASTCWAATRGISISARAFSWGGRRLRVRALRSGRLDVGVCRGRLRSRRPRPGALVLRRHCSASGARPLPCRGSRDPGAVVGPCGQHGAVPAGSDAGGRRETAATGWAVRRFGRRVTPWRTCRTSPGSVRTGKASPR